MAAAYQIGFRVALIAGGAGALGAAQASAGTQLSLVASLGIVGIVTTLLVREPEPAAPRRSVEREARVVDWLERRAHWPRSLRNAGAWFIGAVICPFVDFFARYGARLGVGTLVLVGTYRLTEYAMGSQVNPFYIDHGYSLDQIAWIVKLYGSACRCPAWSSPDCWWRGSDCSARSSSGAC